MWTGFHTEFTPNNNSFIISLLGEKVREMPVTYIGNWYFTNFSPPSVQACLELQVTDIYLGIQPFVGGKKFGKSQLLLFQLTFKFSHCFFPPGLYCLNSQNDKKSIIKSNITASTSSFFKKLLFIEFHSTKFLEMTN